MSEENVKEPKDLDQLVVQNIMRTEEGRNWIYNKLSECGVFESNFSSDPLQNAFNSGVREAGLKFDRDLRGYSIDYYTKMIKENS